MIAQKAIVAMGKINAFRELLEGDREYLDPNYEHEECLSEQEFLIKSFFAMRAMAKGFLRGNEPILDAELDQEFERRMGK